MRNKRTSLKLNPTLTALGIGAYALFLRQRLLRWGATGEEARRPLPGDSLIPDPNYQSTRAIIIRSAPKDSGPGSYRSGTSGVGSTATIG